MNYQSMVEMACYALEHGCKATYAGLGVLLCESPSCLNLACVADHQDQQVVIQEGDTITNIYYVTDSGGGTENPDPGGSGGDGTDDDSIWDKLGGILGTLISVPVKIITAIVSKALDALQALADVITEKLVGVVESILAVFNVIPTLFGGLVGFLCAKVPFIPEEIMNIFILGAFLTIVIWIIKAIRGR